ncbi:hypothetical protein [Hymenobacter rubidus]|uniref:hypothetical protein n=1 Tax=Hymenobacter rubidus TaxID=1441626 RepID=UPI00191DE984|nr:hypothetical protein [Hymenobacter rubidus]
MEAPAPYHTAPKGPRDLSAPLAAWLRAQGFTAVEQARPTTATVAAHWLGPQGERFQLDYTWLSGPVPSATCWLRVHYPGQPQPETLFTGQQVRRLREARQLLLGCVRYANARTLARLVPAPAHL